MKSTAVVITEKGLGVFDALALTEKIGREQGLDKKSAIRLRLLAEELCGMLRGIAGEVRADYWLVYENTSFELHMKANVSMTEEMRDQFLAASTSGKNDAARGFMGKIRVMIANALLPSKDALPYTMTNIDSFSSVDTVAGQMASMWSMMAYKEELQKASAGDEKARAAWDELEKSIVASIADDVKVKVVGTGVEIVVIKSFTC